MQLVAEPDGLDAFGSEAMPVLYSPEIEPSSGDPDDVVAKNNSRTGALTWAALFFSVAGFVGTATWQYQRLLAPPAPGTLTVQTATPGADVSIGGRVVGRTPVTVSLAPGSYRIRVGSGERLRDIDVAVASGATIQQFLEVPSVAAEAAGATAGSLQVQTDLPSMSVLVDGVERGLSPLTVTDLTPGDHQVVVKNDRQAIRRTVAIKTGETVSLVLSSIGTTAPAPGWLAVSAPMVMQLREGGQLIGTTEAEKLMLAAGDHDIEIANDAIGFKTSQRITVAPGKTASVAVDLPPGSLSINAQPWAEVWLDGERMGETPLANLNVRLGTHEVILRHPQLGERRESVLVTLRQPARLGVDLRRP
jgi:diacylglycerol kinase family enzyme